MRKRDCVIAWLIIVFGGILFCFLNARITPTISQNLVVFFSIVFGFYITSIAMLFGSSYAKYLHEHVDSKLNMRSIYVFKEYIEVSSYFLIFSICLVLLSGILFHIDEFESPVLSHSLNIPFINKLLNADIGRRIFSAIILGLSSANVFWMIRIFQVVLRAMILEAKKE